jgi:hypothetical protein
VTRVSAVALPALLLISAGVSTPTGPTVAVMPPYGKPLGMFQDDDTVCRPFASVQVEGEAAHANWMHAAIAGGGTLLGAGLGAAIGGGQGAGAGALGGTAISAIPSSRAQTTIQDRYDIVYDQCMFTRGNPVPGFQQLRVRR